MSTSICQGLQSCLDPWLVESRVLRLKLAQPTSSFNLPSKPPALFDPDPEQSNSASNKIAPDDSNQENETEINDSGCWSFLQSLTNSSPNSKDVDFENEKTEYVHPMSKRSASVLSERSLEMCTESLGSETGSIMSDSSDDFSYLSLENERYQPPKLRDFGGGRRPSSARGSFPPPLSTMSGVQVMGHREDGRLVMKAVAVKTPLTCFKAERRDGRLRLHFVANEEEDEEEEEEDDCVGEDMEGINWSLEGESGIEVDKVPMRPSRCKEGGGSTSSREMLPLKHFWVASS